MARGADEALRLGLKAAADRFARAMRTIAGMRTRETAAQVNVVENTNENLIRGGHPGGGYGWEPIQALMFDNNLRHPLFGNKRHWYKQGRYPITQYTERAAIDDATEAFADAFVPAFVKEYGFDE
jgi:hypothetical protein